MAILWSNVIKTLLVILIFAGVIALSSAALALSTEKGKKFHVLYGKSYFWAMVLIFLTAIPMSILKSNIFLFLIAIFSFYLAFSGMRFAGNRKGVPVRLDFIAVNFMFLSGAGMWILAIIFFINNNSQFITLIVFGFLALFLGYGDFQTFKNQTATGKERIAKHLTNMMGGTIAVVTAVLVVNPPADPEWVWWILPTVLITPVITWWNKKVLN